MRQRIGTLTARAREAARRRVRPAELTPEAYLCVVIIDRCGGCMNEPNLFRLVAELLVMTDGDIDEALRMIFDGEVNFEVQQ